MALEQLKASNNIPSEDKTPNFVFDKMSTYDSPKAIEQKTKDYVLWGKDNLYFNELQDLSMKSAMHAAIIKTKTNLTAGAGIEFTAKNINSELDIATAQKWFDDINGAGCSLQEENFKYAADICLYGGMAVSVSWDKGRSAPKTAGHVDFASVRSGKANKDGKITEYYICNNWADIRNNEIKTIQAFDPENIKKGQSQLIYVKPYTSNFFYYPLPDYIAAINYIALDYKISNFHINAIKNGLAPSMLINFNIGDPTEEEKRATKTALKKLYASDDNAGNFFITWSSDKDKAPNITTLTTSDLDKQYIALQELVLTNITAGHRINPVLAGIQVPGKLGTRNELLDSLELFKNDVIREKQLMIENVFNLLLGLKNLQVKMNIKQAQPIKFQLDQQTLSQNLTKNEIRDLIDYGPIEKQDKEPLIEKIGQVGVQSLLNILTAQLTTEQKINILISLYGMDIDQATSMVAPVSNIVLNGQVHN